MTDMNSPSCSASASTADDCDDQQGTSSERSADTTGSPNCPGEENKPAAPAPSVSLEERMRPVGRPYSLRRRLHLCIAAIQDRRANPSHHHRFDLLARRQRNPERDLLLDYRRELRRLWMYLDAIAVIRLSRVPPGG